MNEQVWKHAQYLAGRLDAGRVTMQLAVNVLRVTYRCNDAAARGLLDAMTMQKLCSR